MNSRLTRGTCSETESFFLGGDDFLLVGLAVLVVLAVVVVDDADAADSRSVTQNPSARNPYPERVRITAVVLCHLLACFLPASTKSFLSDDGEFAGMVAEALLFFCCLALELGVVVAVVVVTTAGVAAAVVARG